jgi:hypothetical protein
MTPKLPSIPRFHLPPLAYGATPKDVLDDIDRVAAESKLLRRPYTPPTPLLPGKLVDAVGAWFPAMFEYDGHARDFPPPWTDQQCSVIREERHRYKHYLEHQREMWALLNATTLALVEELKPALPAIAASRRLEPIFLAPLYQLLPDPARVVELIFEIMLEGPYREGGFMIPVANHLLNNLARITGGRPDYNEPYDPSDYTLPGRSSLAPDKMVDAYLSGSPFELLLKHQVPVKWRTEDRMAHTHILGGPKAGKTTLLKRIIMNDLVASFDPPYDMTSNDTASLVIIDPHSDLVRTFARSDLGIQDRLILIDPRDTRHPPALNIFDIKRERLKQYDTDIREQITASALQTFNYVLSGLGVTLTGKQDTLFDYVTQLMLFIPEVKDRNATVDDMIALMHDKSAYKDVIAAAPPELRDFFEDDFDTTIYSGTKEEIRYRLRKLVAIPAIKRIFTSPVTKIDFYDLLNRGSVILIDTAREFLVDRSPMFGRCMISMVLQAIMERAAILNEEDRRPTYLVVDEASAYFDTNIEDLLHETRKFRCGVIIAHHDLTKAPIGLQASLESSTFMKFAGNVSSRDAHPMAGEMRTTREFLLSQPPYHFAAHFKGITPHAVTLNPAPLVTLPQLSEDAYQAFLTRNRERVSYGPQDIPARDPASPQPPDEEISETW